MKNLKTEQNKVARLIQKDIAVKRFPFEEAGFSCELTGAEVLSTIKQFQKEGFIRKFGAVLHHQKAGYKENALVVWSVPDEQAVKAGRILASFSFVSHCYEREPAFLNQYNIFTMIHSDRKDISSLINDMVSATGIEKYLILKSVKEYKKKSPEYF
ncbi:MAG: Lrp/AsnC family transcriptional regulator [Deltaproteobacteria bacterium]|nr:Lrp/AsnC family transcriptional regulator [Deltaproteobacteria bacterium]